MPGETPPDRRPDPDADRLLLDVMLGKLATYLRMCGYDAAYALDRELEADDRVLDLAAAEGRRLLTRDVDLARRAGGDEGEAGPGPGAVLLRSREVGDQLRELREAGFALDLADPPTRCGRCNGPVERAATGESARADPAVSGDSNVTDLPADDPAVPGDSPADHTPDRPEYVPDDGPVWRCRECGQFFWKGSHWADVRERLAGLDDSVSESDADNT